jgi:hypothetical protein
MNEKAEDQKKRQVEQTGILRAGNRHTIQPRARKRIADTSHRLQDNPRTGTTMKAQDEDNTRYKDRTHWGGKGRKKRQKEDKSKD